MSVQMHGLHVQGASWVSTDALPALAAVFIANIIPQFTTPEFAVSDFAATLDCHSTCPMALVTLSM